MTKVEFTYLIEILEKFRSPAKLRIIYEINKLESKNLSVYVALIANHTEKSVTSVNNHIRILEKERLIILIREITCQDCFKVYKRVIPPRCECGAKILNLKNDFEKKSNYPHFLIQLAEDMRKNLTF